LEKADQDYKNKKFDPNKVFTTQEEKELIIKLSQYKDILEETAKNLYPHILANYLYELTKIFNNFYNNTPVLKETDEDKKLARLKLIDKTTKIIKD